MRANVFLSTFLLIASIVAGLTAVTLLPKAEDIKNVNAASVCPNGSYFSTTDNLCHQDIGFTGNKCFDFSLPDTSNNCVGGKTGIYACAATDANLLLEGGDNSFCSTSPYFKRGFCVPRVMNNIGNLTANEANLDAIMAYQNITNANGNAITNNDTICNTSTSLLITDGFSNPQRVNIQNPFTNPSPCQTGFRVFMDGSSAYHTLDTSYGPSYVQQFICIDKNFADGATYNSAPIYTAARVVHSGTQYDNDSINVNQGCSEYGNPGNYVKVGRSYLKLSPAGGNSSGSERTYLCSKLTYPASISYCNSGYQTYFSPTFNGCVRTFAATSFSCPAGQYLSNPATNSCTTCTAGSFCDGGLGAVKVACLGGTYCPARSIAPTDCPAGSFCGASVGIPAICSPNTYCPQNSVTAINCPAGTVSNTESSFASDCTPTSCPTGQTLTVGVCARNPGLYTDVKYSTTANGVESNIITTSPGSTVYQRIYYENTGTDAVSEASIKTALPAGFTYVPGSFAHCKIPTVADLYCDTKSSTEHDDMFSTMLNTGLSPASTFYDGADTGANGTATLAAKGILDAGKKQFINIENCNYSDATLVKEFSLALKSSPDNFGSNKTTASNNPTPYGCRFGSTANPYNGSYQHWWDITNYKNFYLAQCKATSPTEGKFISWGGGTGKVEAQSGPADSDSYIPGQCVTSGDYTTVSADSGYQKATLLGNRYLNMSQCFYNDTALNRITNLIDSTPNSTNAYNFKANTFGSDIPATALDCGIGGNGYTRNSGLSAFKAIDLLDTSRSKGYFEFEILVPTTNVQSTYPQSATITAKDSAGAVITPISSNGVISVITTPTLGTTPLGTVTGTVGSALPTIALVGSNIPDNTVAAFTPAGTTTSIPGKIIGGNFVPDAPATIPTGSLTGTQTGVLTVTNPTGVSPINVNTNFSVVSISSFSSASSISSSSPTSSTSSSTSSSSSTTTNSTRLALKVLLSGNFDTNTNLMKTTLKSSNLIPAAQPYNVAPFNYAGTETTVPASLPTNAVDWVLVEIKDAPGNATVQKKAAILLSDGSVIDSTTGATTLTIPGIGNPGTLNYKVIVRHRNHLAIATDLNIPITGNTSNTLDLTTNNNVKASNQLPIGTVGKYGMRLANVNGDDRINATDKSIIGVVQDAANIYNPKDVNLDGIINATDKTLVGNAQDAIENL